MHETVWHEQTVGPTSPARPSFVTTGAEPSASGQTHRHDHAQSAPLASHVPTAPAFIGPACAWSSRSLIRLPTLLLGAGSAAWGIGQRLCRRLLDRGADWAADPGTLWRALSSQQR